MRTSVLFLTPILIGLTSLPVRAGKNPMKTRPCTPQDILGTWQAIAVSHSKPPAPGKKRFNPYLVYRFDKNGQFQRAESTKPFSPADLSEVFTSPSRTPLPRYIVGPHGQLRMFYPDLEEPHEATAFPFLHL